MKGLYDRGFSRGDVLEIFRFIDWMMTLPEALERGFEREIEEYEGARTMSYMTTWERRGLEKGREEGRVAEAQAILRRLGSLRFGPPSGATTAFIDALNAPEALEALTERLLQVESWDELLER